MNGKIMLKVKRVGIVGCGSIAGLNEEDSYRKKPCTHAGAYMLRKDVNIVGCCDVKLERSRIFAKKFNIPFFTTSINKLLNKNIHILSICVPYKYNYSLINKIVKSVNPPKKILLEKPISNNFSSAKKIVKLCRKNNIKLYVNNRQLSYFYKIFNKTLNKEFDNNILSITAWCSSGIHTIGIHMVDLLRNISGEVKSVYAFKERFNIRSLPYSKNFTSEDPRFNTFLEFKNGNNGVLFNSAKSDFTFFEVEAICKTGRIRASDNGNKLVYQKKIPPKKSTLSYKLGTEKEVKFKSKSLFKLIIDEVLDGSYKKSPINADEALKSYQVIELMIKSSKTKKVQYVKSIDI